MKSHVGNIFPKVLVTGITESNMQSDNNEIMPFKESEHNNSGIPENIKFNNSE